MKPAAQDALFDFARSDKSDEEPGVMPLAVGKQRQKENAMTEAEKYSRPDKNVQALPLSLYLTM